MSYKFFVIGAGEGGCRIADKFFERKYATEAIAINTYEKREYLLLENGLQQKIELIEIYELEVLTSKAKFQKISF